GWARGCAPAAVFAMCCAAATPAAAHGFGQRYDLPLPLSLYIAATGAAVALSFVVVALTARAAPRGYPRLRVSLPAAWLAAALKLVAIVLLLIVIAAGLAGNPDPYRNIAPTPVWTLFWVGLAMISAFGRDLL